MDDAQRRRELKEFLRAHREQLRPEDVGLPAGVRRRTAGLRREEVAALAGLGVTWYTWLEQGREIQASRDALARIARALRLSSSDTAYLLTLAGAEAAASNDAMELDRRLEVVLDCIAYAPALVISPRLDAVAFNALADAIYDFDGHASPFRRNMVWRAYLDPARRRLYPTVDTQVHLLVGLLRGNYASRVGDPSFEDLLGTLRDASPEFARDWAAQHTMPLGIADSFPLDSPLGRLEVWSMRFPLPDRPGYALAVLTPSDATTTLRLRRG